MSKLQVNLERINEDLDASWEVLAEPIQTVMRRYGLPEPYEQLKALTRGRGMTQQTIADFVNGLELPQEAKAYLLGLTPANYVGEASRLARQELEQS